MTANKPLLLAAQGYHLEDHQPDWDVAWSSSLDGNLGTGARLQVALSPGEHTLTARIADVDEHVVVQSQ